MGAQQVCSSLAHERVSDHDTAEEEQPSAAATAEEEVLHTAGDTGREQDDLEDEECGECAGDVLVDLADKGGAVDLGKLDCGHHLLGVHGFVLAHKSSFREQSMLFVRSPDEIVPLCTYEYCGAFWWSLQH